MIQHVYERAVESEATEVIIATDDDRIEQSAKSFGAKVCMTRREHLSGTDRLAEVASIFQFNDDNKNSSFTFDDQSNSQNRKTIKVGNQ